jgi:hypothetical protein
LCTSVAWPIRQLAVLAVRAIVRTAGVGQLQRRHPRRLEPPSRSIRDGEAEPNLSQHLRDEVRRLVRLARELAEQMGADPDDAELIENQVLVAAAAVEAALGAHEAADVGPRGANAEEDEG